MPHDEFFHTPMETISDYAYAHKYDLALKDSYRSRHMHVKTQIKSRPEPMRTQSYSHQTQTDSYDFDTHPPIMSKKKGIAGFFGLGRKHKRDDSTRLTVSSPTNVEHHPVYFASTERHKNPSLQSSPQLRLSLSHVNLGLSSFDVDSNTTSPMYSPISPIEHRQNMSAGAMTALSDSDFYFSDRHRQESNTWLSPVSPGVVSINSSHNLPPRTAPTPTRSSFFTNDESKRRHQKDGFTCSLPAFSSDNIKSPRRISTTSNASISSNSTSNWLQQPPARRPSFNHGRSGTAPHSPSIIDERGRTSHILDSNKLEIESNSSRYAKHRVLTAPKVDPGFPSTRSAPATYHADKYKAKSKEAAFEDLLASGKTKRLQAATPLRV